MLSIAGDVEALVGVECSIAREVCDAMLSGYCGVIFVVDGSYTFLRRIVDDIQLVLARALLDSGS